MFVDPSQTQYGDWSKTYVCPKGFQNGNESKIKYPLATKFILVAMGLRGMPALASQLLRPAVSVTMIIIMSH